MKYDIFWLSINFPYTMQVFINVNVNDLKNWTIEYDIYQG